MTLIPPQGGPRPVTTVERDGPEWVVFENGVEVARYLDPYRLNAEADQIAAELADCPICRAGCGHASMDTGCEHWKCDGVGADETCAGVRAIRIAYDLARQRLATRQEA